MSEASDDAAHRRICLGAIGGPHGVRGAVRISSFAERPKDLLAYGLLSDETGAREFALTLIGCSKDKLVCKVAGVEDRDAAIALRGTRLHVPRARLPEADENETYYHADLVGLRAERTDGAVLGPVTAVLNHGAGDLLEIALTPGGSVLIPFRRETVPAVHVTGGWLMVDLPRGLLDGPDGAGEKK